MRLWLALVLSCLTWLGAAPVMPHASGHAERDTVEVASTGDAPVSEHVQQSVRAPRAIATRLRLPRPPHDRAVPAPAAATRTGVAELRARERQRGLLPRRVGPVDSDEPD